MATAPHAFRRQVADRKAPTPHETFPFTLEWISDTEVDEEGAPLLIRSDTFNALRPTDERLFVLAALTGDEDADGAADAVVAYELLKAILPKEEFRILKARLLDPEDDVNIEMVQEVLTWLMGEWSTFPTKPSPDSSGSQASTGAKSTGRVRGPGSTR